jgi:hypothetical protein
MEHPIRKLNESTGDSGRFRRYVNAYKQGFKANNNRLCSES